MIVNVPTPPKKNKKNKNLTIDLTQTEKMLNC